ncbi:MAG: phosphopantothenoylcysteine decarboxylase [Gemmataceae bacterium]|nr:phosphopantothenoylcysteine decarboxylase [Gemmataceae bacterium]
MANILLGATGSVASIKIPELFSALRLRGHAVKVVATTSSLYFFDPVALDSSRVVRNPDIVIVDEDEWPGREDGFRYRRGDTVQHVELRRWADLFLVAPLDANTLSKFVNGLCNNCLTCVWRAWDNSRPVIVAPAMNTHMWEHPLTQRQFQALATDTPKLRVVGPQVKELACGDVGTGGMAEVADLIAAVEEMLALAGR